MSPSKNILVTQFKNNIIGTVQDKTFILAIHKSAFCFLIDILIIVQKESYAVVS